MGACAACGGATAWFSRVGEHDFHACGGCGLIQLDADVLARIDAGEPVFRYAEGYWQSEMTAARERAYGIGLARAAEVFLCSRRPVERFLDVGSGPGTLLDALSAHVPWIAGRFHGVELFPPPPEERTAHANYHIGRVADLAPARFDGGTCIEVLEHLTPRMAGDLFGQMAAVSADDACYVMNTGLAAFVRNTNAGYLDPDGRGHITIWTVEAVNYLAVPHGMVASPLPGRAWCFLLEKAVGPRMDLRERLSAVLAENRTALFHPGAGASPVALLGEMALRESLLRDEFEDRTRWALELNARVSELQERPSFLEKRSKKILPMSVRRWIGRGT